MDYFLDKYTEQRIEQISSQSVSNKEVTSAESIKDVDVDKKFLKVIKSLFELKKQQTNEFSKKNKLIHTIKIRIDRLFKDVTTSKNTKFDNIVVLAIANYYMGTIYTEDPKSEKLYSLSIAEVYYKRCLKLLKEKELERKAIVITIRVLDELYEISYKREQSEKSYSVLNTAMELYSEYTKGEIEYPDPIDLTVILGVNFEEVQNPKVLLEQLHLNILKNLSYLYLDYSEKYRRFVVCIHDILSKRIKETMSSNENIIFWAITSLELSCYFLHNYLFTEARNHIAAAEYMTNIFQINARTKNQENPILHINLCKLYEIVRGYISRCWAAYGVQLLHKSEERLLPRKEGNISWETDDSKSESFIESEKDLKLLIFTDLEKDLKNVTAQFTDKYVFYLNDAKKIFVNVLEQLDIAEKYFEFSAENLYFFFEKALLTSMAYQYLTDFYQSKDRKMKLTTRRIDVLENSLQQIKMYSNTSHTSPNEENMLHIYMELTDAYNKLIFIKKEY